MKLLGHVLFWTTILGFIAVFIWAGFDVHNRVQYAVLAQIPVLLMLLVMRVIHK